MAVAVPGDDQEPAGTGDHAQHQAETGTRYRDQASGFRVEIPAGWRRAREVVIPELINPREILFVSTFPVDSSARPCGPFYDHVVGQMGRHEALVAVQERGGRKVAGRAPGFPLRRKRFRLPIKTPQPTGCAKSRERRLVHRSWMSFRDSGRGFYALVAIGSAAPGGVRRDAMGLLDSLRFKRRGAFLSDS